MTGDRKDARAGLRRLADALASDILNAPEGEILAEASEIYGESEKMAADLRDLFERTMNEPKKAKLAEARAAMSADRRKPATVAQLDPIEARRRLQDALAKDPTTARKFTLAARKSKGLSDEDVKGILEDLEELGVIIPSS